MKYKSLHDSKNQNASKYLSTDKYSPPLSTSSSPPQSSVDIFSATSTPVDVVIIDWKIQDSKEYSTASDHL